MAADLDTLLTADIPEGRQNLLDSFTNLERVAEYCENNYYQCENKRAALEETKSYTTQSLASVAYQINTLAYNFLQALDLQGASLGEMESQVNHITQTVGIHKEKVARREIGVLTTNKSFNRQYKIIAPATPERPIKYVRKPIDFSLLDSIGHGVRVATQQSQPKRVSVATTGGGGAPSASNYGPGLMNSTYGSIGNVSTNSAGPAPTTKPPTPPQAARYSTGGTLNRSKEYRTPPMVAPPQVPSNYAPNYPGQYQKGKQQQQQYGTMPHPQVQMVHPVQQPLEHSGATMPRLSSASMRSTSSHSSTEYPMMSQQHISSTLGRPQQIQQQQQLYRQSSATPPSSLGSRQSTPPSAQYGIMVRPSQRPPSPPLPPPPSQQMNPVSQPQYMQQQQQPIYSRQNSEPRGILSGNHPVESLYARQLSAGAAAGPSAVAAVNNMTLQQQLASRQQQIQQQQLQSQYGTRQQFAAAAAASSNAATPPKMTNDKGLGLPRWVPKNYIERVTAIYDYAADKDDELSFQEGATIYVLKKNDDGWWEGVMDGVTGLFPGNYVEATI